jgi:uncharacterized protein (TIGR02246 family)
MNQTQVTAQLQRRVSEIADAWNRGDLQTYGAVFADDADFVDTSGGLTSGRAAIAAVHEREYATSLAGTQMEVEGAAVRPLSDEAAVVRIENRFQPGDRRIIMTAALQLQAGNWRIIAAQASLRR